MKRLATSSGFTLVEALGAGAVGVIIAGVAVAVFLMHDRELRESTATLKLQRQYENLRTQIAMDARAASRVLQQGDGFTIPFTPLSNVSGVTNIEMRDTGGTVVATYSIASNQVLRNGAAFEAGGGTISVDDANSYFSLPALRNRLDIRMVLTTQIRGSTYELAPRKDAFQCRN